MTDETTSRLPNASPARYEVQGEIARGGLGRILRARDLVLGRPVALKELIEGARPKATQRFVREALITARLQHPGVVPIYEAGRWPTGEPFYAMKMVSGRSLDQLIAEATSLDERLALMPSVLAVAETMAYAHEQRIIHRDLKPANILVGAFGETVVIDWGLTKDLADPQGDPDAPAGPSRANAPGGTIDGQVIGTPSYMPPEQANGEAVDERADVYALGAVLYHVLAGTAPFEGHDVKVIWSVLTSPPTPLGKKQTGVPPELVAIVEKAMARAPADRYPTAKELADDLRRFQTGQLVGAHTYTLGALAQRWLRKNVALAAVMLAALLMLVIGGAFSVRSIVDERDRANREKLAAADRAEALVLVEAKHLLDSDPTASLAWLKRLPPESTRWGAARIVAADARDRGVALLVKRHEGRVYSVAYSPDGRLVASWSQDRRVRVTEVATGESRVVLEAGGKSDLGGGGVSFTRDGKRLLVRLDGRARELDLETGAIAFSTDPPADGDQDPRRFAMSEDGSRVVVGSGASLELFDVASGARRKLISGTHLEAPRPVLSADGNRLAAVIDGTLHAFDFASSIQRDLTTFTGDVHRVVFSPDGTRLAAIETRDRDIHLYDLNSGAEKKLVGHGDPPRSIVFSTNGKKLASVGSFDGAVRIWNLEDGGTTVIKGDPSAIAFSPDGRTLAMVTFTAIDLVELETGLRRTLAGHEEEITAIAFAPDGTRLASASFDRTVRVWDLATTPSDAMEGEMFEASPDGRSITVLSGEDLRVFETPPKRGKAGNEETRKGRSLFSSFPDHLLSRVKQSPELPPNNAGRVAYSPDGSSFAIAGDPIRVFDLRTKQPRELSASALAVGFTGRALLALDRDGILREVPLDGGTARELCTGLRATIDHDIAFSDRAVAISGPTAGGSELCPFGARAIPLDDVRLLAFSPKGDRFVTSGRDPVLRLRDASTGAILEELAGHEEPISALAFSADGTRLASGDAKLIRVWDIAAGTSTALRGHRYAITSLAFSADGTHLASTAQDFTLRVWHLATGTSRALRGHTKQNVLEVAFLADRLISAGDDGTIRLWTDDLPTDGHDLLRWLDAATRATIGPGEILAGD